MLDGRSFVVFEMWAGLPWPMRVGIATVILGVTTLLYWLEYIPFRPALLGWAIGSPLFVFAWPSDSERRGYRF
ncbi:MAG: hypothetical protein CHACPFDD_03713 [Phycisphaerae bacterium]|nr:hypothetical protein [Phycisphaerae bacterium]